MIKQVVDNIELQIKVYGNGSQLVRHSLAVVDSSQYGQLELRWINDDEQEYQTAVLIIPYKTASLFQRTQKLTALDLLKALKEIGNAMVREWDAYIIEHHMHHWVRPYNDDGRDMNAVCDICGAPEE